MMGIMDNPSIFILLTIYRDKDKINLHDYHGIKRPGTVKRSSCLEAEVCTGTQNGP